MGVGIRIKHRNRRLSKREFDTHGNRSCCLGNTAFAAGKADHGHVVKLPYPIFMFCPQAFLGKNMRTLMSKLAKPLT
jgi:hypothetical protein